MIELVSRLANVRVLISISIRVLFFFYVRDLFVLLKKQRQKKRLAVYSVKIRLCMSRGVGMTYLRQNIACVSPGKFGF